MAKAKSIMVLGTASGVGKSILTAGLCRILSDRGLSVAPFKAQNMSNNSYVTEDCGEIGRAQAVQAECARIEPTIHMNPVLLKPAADNRSQVIVHGKPVGHFSAKDYYSRRDFFIRAVRESYEELASRHDVVVLEGAGSPAEINLRESDFVNMRMAALADAACLLVGDIDKGGVFASLIGTLELLLDEDRERIKAFVINKFRGDRTLLDGGVRFLEERTGKKVLGVLPYLHDLWIPEEDGIDWTPSGLPADGKLEITVVLLPRISNLTDFEILKHEREVKLTYARRAVDIGQPDLLILPGTKATIDDLEYLRKNGFCDRIAEYVGKGGRVLGICGGFQMMGRAIHDQDGYDGHASTAEGLALFEMITDFQEEKIVRPVSERIAAELFGSRVKGLVQGYEIHQGRSRFSHAVPAFGQNGAVHPSGRFAGTYCHGVFDEAGFRKSFLRALAVASGKTLPEIAAKSAQELKEENYQKLAGVLREYLDLEWLDGFLEQALPESEETVETVS